MKKISLHCAYRCIQSVQVWPPCRLVASCFRCCWKSTPVSTVFWTSRAVPLEPTGHLTMKTQYWCSRRRDTAAMIRQVLRGAKCPLLAPATSTFSIHWVEPAAADDVAHWPSIRLSSAIPAATTNFSRLPTGAFQVGDHPPNVYLIRAFIVLFGPSFGVFVVVTSYRNWLKIGNLKHIVSTETICVRINIHWRLLSDQPDYYSCKWKYCENFFIL